MSKSIIIDIGTNVTKVGFGGDDTPFITFPTVISQCGKYIGEEALKRKDTIILSYPVENGLITKWDDMEKILHDIFINQLKKDSKGQSILVTDSIKNTKENREKMAKLMFERFNVGSFYIGIHSVLSSYATGRKTGLVVDIGDGVGAIVPVVDGFGIRDKVKILENAGRDLTIHLQELCKKNNRAINDLHQVQQLKETSCYVAKYFDAELKKTQEQGDRTEFITCPELLFKEGCGLSEKIVEVINSFEGDTKSVLYQNIVLAGGSTNFKGLGERLKKDLVRLSGEQIRLVEAENRQNLAWIGGSLLAALDDFKGYWVTKSEYESKGFEIVHKKCY